MARHSNQVVQQVEGVNVPVVGAKVYVYDLDGALAALTDDASVPLDNPVTSDAYGNFYYNAPAGVYRHDYWYGGKLRYTDAVVMVGEGLPLPDSVLQTLIANTGASFIGTSEGGTVEQGLQQRAKLSALASSAGSALVYFQMAEGLTAKDLQTALRLSLPLKPEFFAQNGDLDDSAAIERLRDYVQTQGGGSIELTRGKTYIVGEQTFDGSGADNWAYKPRNLLYFQGLTKSISIRMWGATIKCRNGAKYGSFNPTTGNRHDEPGTGSFTNLSYRATPYWAMVGFYQCTGPIRVEGGELDGNIANLDIGGRWNDTGIQIGCFGLYFQDCDDFSAIGVYTHDHGLDGVSVGYAGLTDASTPRPGVLINVRSRFNGRQALSWVGGNQLTAINGDFSKTGRRVNVGTGVPFYSAPGAGIDIEAEGAVARNGLFLNCYIADNIGVGVVAHAASDNADVHFVRCKIVGTTTWSVWANDPGMSFDHCLIVGTMTNAHNNDTLPARSAYFNRCYFTVDTALSETGTVYTASYLCAEINVGPSVMFDRCQFNSAGNTTKPLVFFSQASIRDCYFKQDGTGAMVVRGNVFGVNFITTAGTVSRSPGTMYGRMIVNGVEQEVQTPTLFSGNMNVSGTKLTPGTGFAVGAINVSAQNAVVGDAARLSLDHGTGGGNVYFDSVLQASNYGTLSVRIRGVGGMNERFRIDNAGAAFFPGVATTASAANAFLDNAASNSLLRSTSSIRYKTDIETVEPEYDERIFELRPVFYRSLAEADNPAWGWWGLIAEEVAEIDPRLVHWSYPPEAYEAVTTKQRQLVSGPNAKRKRYKAIETTEYVLKPNAEKVPDGVQYERLSVLLLSNYRRKVEDIERRLQALEAGVSSAI